MHSNAATLRYMKQAKGGFFHLVINLMVDLIPQLQANVNVYCLKPISHLPPVFLAFHS